MHTLQQQDNAAVSAKIDALHLIVEQLSDKVSSLIAAQGLAPREQSISGFASDGRLTQSEECIGHQDLIPDGIHPTNLRDQMGEHSLAPEIQIQRLTAQLTAAYNRIAALEEQLLAQRTL